MRIAFLLFVTLLLSPLSYAGAQQDFFAAKVQRATRVRIIKIGPDKTPSGALQKHLLLDASEKKAISSVVAAIALVDPRPERGAARTFGREAC
jgi:hypothetical protein